jgi:hypothetical protein
LQFSGAFATTPTAKSPQLAASAISCALSIAFGLHNRHQSGDVCGQYNRSSRWSANPGAIDHCVDGAGFAAATH